MTEIRVGTVSDAAGTGPAALTGQWASKAYAMVVTDAAGSGDTANQSSISDGGQGRNTHSFTNSFSSTNYGHAGAQRHDVDNDRHPGQDTANDATGSCSITMASDSGANSDYGYDILWWGDLA